MTVAAAGEGEGAAGADAVCNVLAAADGGAFAAGATGSRLSQARAAIITHTASANNQRTAGALLARAGALRTTADNVSVSCMLALGR